MTSAVPAENRPTPVDAPDADLDAIVTHAAGPIGSLPLDADLLRDSPSGDIFGLTQNAGMGWEPRRLRSPEFLILGTQGGIRAPDGRPIALGYHTGHWEIGLLMQEAAEEFDRGGATPFAGFVSDPCDGRSQGTTGMMESLAYRNDAAIVFRRLIRSLPTRRGVMGVATCDKGLPAMMLALAAQGDLPVIIVPGGVTLPPTVGEHAGAVQTVGVRFTHGKLTVREAAELGCAACATPGGGCQFLGTAATARWWPRRSASRSAIPRSRPPVSRSGSSWRGARRERCRTWPSRDVGARDIVTDDALHNAMVVHAAFGGSTNLLLHVPAIAFAAGLQRPDRRGLDAHQPRRAAARERSPERAGRPPDGACLPRRRRAGGDAPAPRSRAAPTRRHDGAPEAAWRCARRVGAQRPAHARARAPVRARRRRP